MTARPEQIIPRDHILAHHFGRWSPGGLVRGRCGAISRTTAGLFDPGCEAGRQKFLSGPTPLP